ncbi:MAG: hypothetical protein ACREM2_11445 [Vulcanimicrobiaceae bacterium]
MNEGDARPAAAPAGTVAPEPADPDLVAIAESLVTHRVAAGLSLEAVAAESAIALERLAGAEAATLALSDAELERLAERYGVAVTSFFGGRVTPVSYLFGG